MKIVIWIGCAFVYGLIVTLLHEVGIMLGGIPTALLFAAIFAPAPALYKRWDKRKEAKQEQQEQALERWWTCKECGQLVRAGAVCDCSSLESQEKPKLCGTPFVQAGENPPGVESAVVDHTGAKPEETKKKAPHGIIAIMVCLCLLSAGASAYVARGLGYEYGVKDGYEVGYADGKEERSRTSDLLLEKRNSEIADLKSELEDEKAWNEKCLDLFFGEAVFLNTKIGFIVEGDSKYYHVHQYGCTEIDGEYWAHNIEYCEYIGYSPCPKCW